MAKRIPVLVVEDNRLLRDGITAMMAEQHLPVAHARSPCT
jgi:hypothetical protein